MIKILSVLGLLLISNAYASSQFPVEYSVRACIEDDPTIFIQNIANEHCLKQSGIPSARKVGQILVVQGRDLAWGTDRTPISCSMIVTKTVSALFECVDER